MPVPGEKSHKYPIKVVHQEGGSQTAMIDGFVVFDEEQPDKIFIETSRDSRTELEFTPLIKAISKYTGMLTERFINHISDKIGDSAWQIFTEESIELMDAPPELKEKLRSLFGYGSSDGDDK